MKKLNKRGFTMVELLATIVIIGILGTVGVVGVTKSIKSAKDRYYVAQNKLFISAAQTYFTDNKSRLPMKSGTSKKVTLQTLNDENYIEKMVDYSKKSYKDDSFVRVTKLGLNMYSYSGKLIDSKGTVQEYKESGDKDAKVTFKIDSTTFLYNATKYTNSKKDVGIEIEDADGIAGYIISITKRDKTVNEMDYIEVGGATTAKNQITISTDKYGDGEYRVKVKVYDKYNDQMSFTSGKVVVDTIAPKCENIKFDGNKGKDVWYTSNKVKTSPICRDLDKNGSEKNASGCDTSKTRLTATGSENKNNLLTNEFVVKNDGVTNLSYTIYDKAGNETNCEPVELKKDSTPPTCGGIDTGTYNGNWTKENVVLKVGCSDSISNCEKSEFETTFSRSMNEYKSITISDNAGNTNNCGNVLVKIDKDKPEWIKNCSNNPNCNPDGGITYIYNDTWVKDKHKMGQFFNSSISGIKKIIRYQKIGDQYNYKDEISVNFGTSDHYRQTNEYSETQNNTICFELENSVGEKSNKSCVDVKIDNTLPTITITSDGPGTKGQHTGTCQESGSGIREFKLHGEEGEKDDHYGLAGGTSSEIITSWTTNNEKSPTYRCEDDVGNSTTLEKYFWCKCYKKGNDGKSVLVYGWDAEKEYNCYEHNLQVGCSDTKATLEFPIQ